jgi:hypothetical protein
MCPSDDGDWNFSAGYRDRLLKPRSISVSSQDFLMLHTSLSRLAVLAACVAVAGWNVITPEVSAQTRSRQAAQPEAEAAGATAEQLVSYYTRARGQDDVTALEGFRPGFAFWQHIFTIPDGSIAYGSAQNGRLLAVFPVRGDWTRDGVWSDAQLARLVNGERLPSNLDDRRDRVAELLEPVTGPLLHNATRGQFLAPSARRYAGFLGEWGAIYERFGVPAEIGLAQALIESGFAGTRRSEARAVGFCQWLERAWKRLNTLDPHVIEAHNQTTQAAYCAAYLTILATKYGSFIPALSEHHAGGANVGRLLINGERLGGEDTREQYFLGSDLVRDLRVIAPRQYSDLYRTYGPRSYRYAEMVFGNTPNVARLMESTRQEKIYAMRVPRALSLSDIVRRTKLSADEVKRYNPALVRQVPKGAALYLPTYVQEFGPDISYWHRPASPAFAGVLNDFVRIEEAPERWDSPAFERVLRDFQRRFRDTKTEEGTVMATVLTYVIEDAATSGRREMLADFRTSDDVRRLFDRALVERSAFRTSNAAAVLRACAPVPDEEFC